MTPTRSTAASALVRNGRLATGPTQRPRPTCYSYLVAATAYAESDARLAMIADGRAPGTTVYTGPDPDGSGLTEVVLTHRPLTRGQSFGASGRRVGTGGTSAS